MVGSEEQSMNGLTMLPMRCLLVLERRHHVTVVSGLCRRPLQKTTAQKVSKRTRISVSCCAN